MLDKKHATEKIAASNTAHELGHSIPEVRAHNPRKSAAGVWSAACERCHREVQVLPNGTLTGSALTSQC